MWLFWRTHYSLGLVGAPFHDQEPEFVLLRLVALSVFVLQRLPAEMDKALAAARGRKTGPSNQATAVRWLREA